MISLSDLCIVILIILIVFAIVKFLNNKND
jgi:hypothetical protein